MTKKDFIEETFGTATEGQRFFKPLLKYTGRTKNKLLGKGQGEDCNHIKLCFDHWIFEDGKRVEPKWTKNSVNPFIRHWIASSTVDEFISAIRQDKETMYSQLVAELLKDDWKFKREQIGEKQFKTASDAGSVKVGDFSNQFSVLIPNGYGDGESRVAVFSKNEEFNDGVFKFFTTISGEDMHIFNYDCGGEPIVELTGERYSVYYGDGFVIFKEL